MHILWASEGFFRIFLALGSGLEMIAEYLILEFSLTNKDVYLV